MKNKSKQVTLLSVFFVFFIVIAILTSIFILLLKIGIIVYSQSPSIKYGFFLVTGGEINVGDYVIFNAPENPYGFKKLLKKVEKIEKDNLFVTGRTSKEIEKETGIANLISYDSKIFGYIKKYDCKKVIELSFINSFLN